MSRNAHNDAPHLSNASRVIYNMLSRQEQAATIRRYLRDEFNITDQLETLPAYIQPNGFHTYKLGGIDGDYLLRLHYWPENLPEAGASAGIHDHVFDFTSLVLGGHAAMINTHYELEQSTDSSLSLYKVDYKNPKDANIIKLGDHFRPVATHQDIVAPNAYYTFPAGKFHTSRIENNKEAFTLLATKLNPLMDGPRFLAGPQYTPGPGTRQNPTPEQRAHVAARLTHFLTP